MALFDSPAAVLDASVEGQVRDSVNPSRLESLDPDRIIFFSVPSTESFTIIKYRYKVLQCRGNKVFFCYNISL